MTKKVDAFDRDSRPAEQAAALGAMAVIRKPMNVGALMDAIRR